VPGQTSCKRCKRPVPLEGGRARPAVHCRACGFTFVATPSSMEDEPRLMLRPDLVIEALEQEGSLRYVIKDPRTNRFFRVKPLEHFLVSQFDGETSSEEVRRRASELKQVLISEQVLSRFTEKFRALGLLVNARGGDEVSPPRTSRFSDVFSLKLPLANPERLLDWLYPKVRFCFSAPFVGLVGSSFLVALFLTVLHRDELVFGLADAASLKGLMLVLLTISGVTILHELAHAVTCRHYGGRVTDMGFLLLYFLPCFYCNVSDTYLLKEKRQRLWVLFAGGFFELFIWASAVITWRIVSEESAISGVLFIIIAVCGIRTLFNFNPLIKMDGYFLLSDYLGVTNLRREALLGLRRLARRAFGLDAAPATTDMRDRRILSMRGDRFLAIFGGVALLYTMTLVGLLVFYSGEWVFTNHGANALALFGLGLLGVLHKPAFTAASAAREAGQEKWEKLGRQRRRFRFVILWSLAILAVAFCPWQLRVPSDLTVMPQEREIVRAPADGRIAKIHVSEGESVEKGDLILEYDTNRLLLDRKTKQAELAQAEEELRLLAKQNPTAREEIRVQERVLETSRAQELAARQEFERAQQAWTLGVLPRDRFDEAKSALEEAEARRREAEAQIALVRKSSPESRNEQMEVYHLRDPGAQQAVIEKLEAELAQLDDLLARSKIYASISGTLTTYRFEEKMGEFLEEGTEVCEIANDERVVIEMPVSEKEIDIVKLDEPVKFKVRGYPTRTFRASVDEIAPVATRNGGSSTILVRAYVDNGEGILKPGMTGVAKIYCGLSVVAHVLTRDIVRFIRTEFWL
jgi:putative peptide zinc metalloprotease protein